MKNTDNVEKMGGINGEYFNSVKIFRDNILTTYSLNSLFLASFNGYKYYYLIQNVDSHEIINK